ncbi:MAG TPA: choice-of-anchor K domain-containing protein [Caulobacteraceae bacterium]|jgi:hypothetical protein
MDKGLSGRVIGGAIVALASAFCVAVSPATAATSYSGTVDASFSGILLSGDLVDGLTGATTLQNNSNTAVFTISNTGGGIHNMLSWGSDATSDHNPPVGDFSTLTFTGKPFSNIAPDQTFDLGTLTYFNGGSDTATLVFGGTLDFSVVRQPTISDAVTGFTISTTSNNGSDAQNADFIGFSAIPSTFNVEEGATASVDVFGHIHGDPQLVLGSIGPGTPEPATWAMLMVGIGIAGAALRRRMALTVA